MFRRLEADAVVATAKRLAIRVAERFEERGLTRVAREVAEVAEETRTLTADLGRPVLWARGVALLVTALVVAGPLGLLGVGLSVGVTTLADGVQALESLVNDVVFAGITIWFVWGIEARRKRSRALRLLVELRALAHVIDMHQLAKDPEDVLAPTPSSPERDLHGPLLARYLDYCSELLSLLGKLAALTAQDLDDPAVRVAVEEVEELTTGLSRKIWQKIMLIDEHTPPAAGDRTEG